MIYRNLRFLIRNGFDYNFLIRQDLQDLLVFYSLFPEEIKNTHSPAVRRVIIDLGYPLFFDGEIKGIGHCANPNETGMVPHPTFHRRWIMFH